MAHTLYDLKPAFQARLRPMVGRLAVAGVTANEITVSALIVSVAVGAAAIVGLESFGVTWPFLLLPAWLPLRMAMNAIDGMLAREFGQSSALGAYLNELSDILSDAALYLPFAFVAPFGPWSVGLVIVAACISELAGALGPLVGATRRYDGPMGKSDRALAFGALATWIGLGLPTGAVLAGLVWLIAALTAVTIVNRIRAGLSEAAASEAKQ
jgi:CDP-diacylglycerol---glycerol-3-phosphate 3-phosphatidyltransferase